jgi:23S rRNA G2069 N7-methylase RlmK/C1962 C5-methylase RlmI
VDSSLPALELAKANASLNQIDANSINFVKADVGEYMKSAFSEGKLWDVVVLDPPKLAPNRKVWKLVMTNFIQYFFVMVNSRDWISVERNA